MSTMKTSLPLGLPDLGDQQFDSGDSTNSEYVRQSIRRGKDRSEFREMLLDGLDSGPGAPADATFFKGLRERIRAYR